MSQKGKAPVPGNKEPSAPPLTPVHPRPLATLQSFPGGGGQDGGLYQVELKAETSPLLTDYL